MSNKRHKSDEIITKLRQAEILRGQGIAMADAVHQIGVMTARFTSITLIPFAGAGENFDRSSDAWN